MGEGVREEFLAEVEALEEWRRAQDRLPELEARIGRLEDLEAELRDALPDAAEAYQLAVADREEAQAALRKAQKTEGEKAGTMRRGQSRLRETQAELAEAQKEAAELADLERPQSTLLSWLADAV